MDESVSELLPWYVNGTLTPIKRRFVEQHLDEHPAYRQHLSFYTAMQEEIRCGVPETQPDIGLASTMKKINADSKERRRATSGWALARNWLGGLLGGPVHWRPIYAFGVVLLATQSVMIGYLAANRGEDYSQTRAKQIVPPSVGPFVKVSFVSNAKEADIRFLMIQLGASIVGGPSQLGDYYLFLQPSRIDWAAAQLRKSPIVDSVGVIATLPAAKE